MDIITISPVFLGLVPAIIALTQLVKTYKYVPSRFVPLFAIVASVGSVALLSDGSLQTIVLQGVLIGLSSVGLFNASRTTVRA